jgi:hypothetical protein
MFFVLPLSSSSSSSCHSPVFKLTINIYDGDGLLINPRGGMTWRFPLRSRVKVRTTPRPRRSLALCNKPCVVAGTATCPQGPASSHPYRTPPVVLPVVLATGIRSARLASRSCRRCGTPLTFGGIRTSCITRCGACLSSLGDGTPKRRRRWR